MNAQQVIELANKHLGKGSMVSSAQLCLADAKNLMLQNEEGYAKGLALKSLAYSVGVFHEDHRAASK